MKAKRPARLRSSSLSARWRSRAARRCHGRRHAGRGSGNVLDEALCVGRTAASFPAADEDYFRDTDYGVTKDMYPWVGECLLATLADVLGSSWTKETEKAWTDAYGAICSLMLAE